MNAKIVQPISSRDTSTSAAFVLDMKGGGIFFVLTL
jgi:hypothetical protein